MDMVVGASSLVCRHSSCQHTAHAGHMSYQKVIPIQTLSKITHCSFLLLSISDSSDLNYVSVTFNKMFAFLTLGT